MQSRVPHLVFLMEFPHPSREAEWRTTNVGLWVCVHECAYMIKLGCGYVTGSVSERTFQWECLWMCMCECALCVRVSESVLYQNDFFFGVCVCVFEYVIWERLSGYVYVHSSVCGSNECTNLRKLSVTLCDAFQRMSGVFEYVSACVWMSVSGHSLNLCFSTNWMV